MKQVFNFLFAIWIVLPGCSNSALQKKLSGSDSLVIHFNTPGSNSVIKTVATAENNAIKRVIHFVDGKNIEQFKCGYDGNLIFYLKGKAILPIAFKYRDPGCRHFVFELENKFISTKMSGEAADFLQSLEEGKLYY